jgi:SAM-dependent methyltransferase
MDLRKYMDQPGAEAAAHVLDYQPFLLADDLQTGVAWSWVGGGDPRVAPRLVFRRDECGDQWEAISDANNRLRALYDDILDDIAARCPGGSLLDVACNNGYFPIGAELRGMRGAGIDLGEQYSYAFKLLNDRLGTKANFIHGGYDSRSRQLFRMKVSPLLKRKFTGINKEKMAFGKEKFDVTVLSAIVCHLPDPLDFFAAVGGITSKMLVFWGQMVDTDALLVSYQPPHPSLSQLPDFPHCFNDNTRISRGMFEQAMRLMGFSTITEMPARPTWLTALAGPAGQPLAQELHKGSRHVVLFATRE